MAGYLSAIIISIIGILIHFLLINLGIIKINPDWCIRKLKRHGQLLLVIWIILLPVFYKLFNLLGEIRITEFTSAILFHYINGILLLTMFFFLYLTVYYVIDRSVSTRIMMEIEASPDKKLMFGGLKEVYDVDTKYRNELQGMIDGGFVKKDGDYYINTPKGMIVGRVTGAYKKLLRLGKGG